MTDKPRKPNPALEKKVRKAITDLQAKGQKPTNSAVQEITGGSFRDISPIVKIVLAEQKAAAAAARAAPDMPEAVFDHATSLWEAAWQAADESAAAERRAHAAELAERDDERADLLESIGIVEDQRDTAETHAKLADERADQAEARAARLSEELVKAKIRIASLEGRLLGRQETEPTAEEVQASTKDEEAEDEGDGGLMPLFRRDGEGPEIAPDSA